MKSLKQSMAIALMVIKATWRNPIVLLSIAVLPLSFYLAFWLIGGMDLSQHVLLGTMVALAQNAGIVSLPQIIVFYKFRRLQDMFVASPVSRSTYMVGVAISRLLYSGPTILIILVIAMALRIVTIQSLPLVLLVLLAAWLVGSMIGFTMATYFDNPLKISPLANLLGMLLVSLPPVLYPVSLLPSKPLQWAVLLIPAASAAELMRWTAGLSELGSYAWALWAVILGYVALMALLVARGSRWREV